MMKRLGSLLAIGALALNATSPISAQEASPSVVVRIAKTAASVIPFGTVEGGSGEVRVRLFKQKDARWRELATERVVPDEDGSFRVNFERPRRGRCRVVARYDRGGRDEEEFPCYIPNFAHGSAILTPGDPLAPATQIDALIADSDRKRGYGLMYRLRLRSDLGMAFLWDGTTTGGFWMKNTLIPLSIAFFDSRGIIIYMTDMEPCEEDPCPSYGPGPDVEYSGALEVNRGAFAEWGISKGDRIEVQP